jgi:hypothetical protein
LKKAIENSSESTTEVFGNSKMLRELHEKLKAFKDDITRASLTGKLWIQYLYYINVIKKSSKQRVHGIETCTSTQFNLFAATVPLFAKYARTSDLSPLGLQQFPGTRV